MNAEFSVSPPVVLRGGRDYVHSTDLYTDLVAALASHGVATCREFDLKIKGKIVTQPRFDFYRGHSSPVGDKPSAIAKFWTATENWVAHVVPGLDPVASRKPYDESGIWLKVRQNGWSFEVCDCDGYTPIEVVTAVGVFAHKTLHPPGAGHRWLLAQISGKRMLAATERAFFRLDIARSMGPKMVQSNMSDANGLFGSMLFVLQ